MSAELWLDDHLMVTVDGSAVDLVAKLTGAMQLGTKTTLATRSTRNGPVINLSVDGSDIDSAVIDGVPIMDGQPRPGFLAGNDSVLAVKGGRRVPIRLPRTQLQQRLDAPVNDAVLSLPVPRDGGPDGVLLLRGSTAHDSEIE